MPNSHLVDLELDSLTGYDSWSNKMSYIRSRLAKLGLASQADSDSLARTARLCQIVFSTRPEKASFYGIERLRYGNEFLACFFSRCLELGYLSALEAGLQVARPHVALVALERLSAAIQVHEFGLLRPWYE